MINSFLKAGLTIPIVGCIILYSIGSVYNSSFMKTLGFGGYTGGIDFNQILLVNRSSLTLLYVITLNYLGFSYVLDASRRKDQTANTDKGKKSNLMLGLGKAEITLSIAIALLFIISNIVYFFNGNYSALATTFLGLALAVVVLGIARLKSYDLRLFCAAVSVTAVLWHAAYHGSSDAIAMLNLEKKVTLELDGGSEECLYLTQDNQSYYLMSLDGNAVSVSKDSVKKIIWHKWLQKSAQQGDAPEPATIVDPASPSSQPPAR